MAVGELALQRVEQFFTTGPESPTGEHEHLVGRLTLQVADHHAEANAAIGQHLVQAVLLGRQLSDQFLPLPRDQAQLAQFRGRHERPAQQSGTRQGGQLLRIADVGLAPGDILDVPGIDDLRAYADRLQRGIQTLPVDAGAFHHNFVGRKRCRPLGQCAPIRLERTKLPLLDTSCTIGLFNRRTSRDICA